LDLAFPPLSDYDALAKWLDLKKSGIHDEKELRAVANRYRLFKIPKHKGLRTISAPIQPLKDIQQQILGGILENADISDDAHGFRPGRSILTNAMQHHRAKVILNIDLKDFFSNIPYARVKNVFEILGYNDDIASLLAHLCTIDVGEYRHLPTGAPTSPQITNILCKRMDERFYSLTWHNRGQFDTYTRYADDLTFSTTEETMSPLSLIGHIRFIIASEGFEINDEKLKLLKSSNRQIVTGLVINDEGHPRLPRKWLRKLRAILHNCDENGIESQSHGDPKKFVAQIDGKIALAMMVDDKRYRKFGYKWLYIKANDRLDLRDR